MAAHEFIIRYHEYSKSPGTWDEALFSLGEWPYEDSLPQERRAKIAAAKRGKPRPAHVVEAIRRALQGKPLSAEARRKMSEAHRRRGTRPPKAGRPWTAAEDRLLRQLRPPEVAELTRRTLRAVYDRRRDLGPPDGRAGRKVPRR